ncbi:MAG: DoxX family protein [Anaerolineales bacterium]|nr:DoxX family protein [Anaerolineales bacterium]
MNTGFIVVQILLAILFFLASLMKVTRSKDKLAESMQWVEGFSGGQVRLIRVLEMLGAVGLVLPALTGILPWLSILNAAGLGLLMVGAIITHLRRKEFSNLMVILVLLALIVLVVYGFISLSPVQLLA